MKYKVRAGFWLHGISSEPIGPGAVVELDADQALRHAHQVEVVGEVKPAPKRKGGSHAAD